MSDLPAGRVTFLFTDIEGSTRILQVARPHCVQPGFGADRGSGHPRAGWGSGRSRTGGRVGKPLAVGTADVEEAIFADRGRAPIASDDSGSVSMVDIATGRRIGSPLSVGDQPAASLALCPDERLLAAASYEGSVFLGDTKTGAAVRSAAHGRDESVVDAAFSPDGRSLVSGHLRSAVVWNISGEQVIGEPLGGPADLTTGVSFSPTASGSSRVAPADRRSFTPRRRGGPRAADRLGR